MTLKTKPLPLHQYRAVAAEKPELLEKLTAFTSGELFKHLKDEDQAWLIRQKNILNLFVSRHPSIGGE